MYRALPADYCDLHTARCRVSPQRFKELGLGVGQWVLVHSTTNDAMAVSQIYCRVWPSRYDCGDAIHVDSYICDKPCILPSTNEHSLAKHKSEGFYSQLTPESANYQVTPVPAPIPKALRLDIIVSQLGNNTSENAEWIKYDEMSETARLNVVDSLPSKGPVLIANGTLLTIVPEDKDGTRTDIQAKPDSQHIDPIASNSADVLPSLEGPVHALLEVVSYPLLYPREIQKIGIECPKGVLLHGPPGVGKTLVVSTVAKICRANMITIYGPEVVGPYVGESEEKLRKRFEDAERMALLDPTQAVIIFIDELDALTPHRADAQAHESRLVAQLLTLMDGVVSRGRVVVIAATNRPNAIDPALRRPGRFDREVRIDVPDEGSRERIIQNLIKKVPHDLSTSDLKNLARMTNGFVGADLESLCRESALHAVYRASSQTTISKNLDESVKVTLDDFRTAFSNNMPSLQRSYGISVEPVHWSDIGGLEDVKKQMRQAVEWPILYKDTFARLGLGAPRGILLYGPPGCSKTTLVKAIATTSGASFLSVNGAALYSSYVGDSEKTIRETFHHARLSAPSIIFFDEIDTIVGKRSFSAGGDQGGGGGDSVQERVLSTMLNEMDGVENAANVLVVAATNRVDLIDKALLRPGRFDRIIYVPPPDLEARKQILKIYTKGIPLDAGVNIDSIAKRTEMYTGADLQSVCREAALVALRSRIIASPLDKIPASDGSVGELVNANDFEKALNVVKASLSEAKLKEYGPSS
ncbi:hypothetical protein BGW38_007192 [Lunasporangiospora selenospora]|uniref:AAA+ ATPase domain-containing protein n=1 Tax=Lunasporangiospora selenospora TaxID=979761 RepID=A0A9P6G3B8_9FUNG|nr:hypothetical protein BGW38_007192 [Lunasporangiospora selenospora]